MDDLLYVVPLSVNSWGGTVWLEDNRLWMTSPGTETPFWVLPFCAFRSVRRLFVSSVHQPLAPSVCCLSVDQSVDDVIRLWAIATHGTLSGPVGKSKKTSWYIIVGVVLLPVPPCLSFAHWSRNHCNALLRRVFYLLFNNLFNLFLFSNGDYFS